METYWMEQCPRIHLYPLLYLLIRQGFRILIGKPVHACFVRIGLCLGIIKDKVI